LGQAVDAGFVEGIFLCRIARRVGDNNGPGHCGLAAFGGARLKQFVMAKKKKVAGFENYILPLFGVGVGLYILNELGLFGPSTPGGFSIPGNSTGIALPGAPSAAQTTANLSAMDSLDAYIKVRNAQNPPQDCFTSFLYKADPSNASISPATAQALWQNIHDAAGTWFSVGNFTGIQADFQAVVGNQTDISMVAQLFEQNDGKDMWFYILNPSTFNNQGNPEQNNLQQVAAFVQWATALPVD
jgi:hypothetical protein